MRYIVLLEVLEDNIEKVKRVESLMKERKDWSVIPAF
jgi:hypothetical protein